MNVNLKAEVRQNKGRRSRNLLANQGKVPAVVYGKGIDSISLAVDAKEVTKILQSFGTSPVVDLKINNEQYKVMFKELQHHPLSQQLMHIDFLKVDLNVLIKANVPIRLVGEPQGIKEGGTLQQQLREVEVECLPTDIPEAIEVDVSQLAVGEGIHIADLKDLKGVEIVSAPEIVIASVVQAQAAPAEDDEEETTTTPEVAPAATPEE